MAIINQLYPTNPLNIYRDVIDRAGKSIFEKQSNTARRLNLK